MGFHLGISFFRFPPSILTQIGNLVLIEKSEKKTYDSGDSPVVTHLTTSPPVFRLSKDDRTGIPALEILWSYVP
jgi:hypothetical protein